MAKGRRPWRYPAGGILAAFISLSSLSEAAANGRPPNTTGLVVQQGNPQQAVALATFGLLIAKDAGLRWQLVCEQAVGGPLGFRGVDPTVLYGAAGHLVVASFDTVAISTDQGCNWRSAAPFVVGQTALQVTGAALHPAQPSTFYVSASGSSSGGIYRSDDGGLSWSLMPASSTPLNVLAVAVSPSAPATLWALGGDRNNFLGPYVRRSQDGGATWTTSPLHAGGPRTASAMQLQLHPTDPQVAFLGITDAAGGGVTVLRTTDGGATSQAVLQSNQALVGLACSPDGSTVFVATSTSLYRSVDGGQSFALLSVPHGKACVGVSEAALGLTYACGNSAIDGFSLALSRDAGATWVPQMQLAQVDAVLRCPAGSQTAAICDSLWPAEAQAIGAPLNGSAGGTVSLAGQQNLTAPPATPYSSGTTTSTTPPTASKRGCTQSSAPPGGVLYLMVLAGLIGSRRWRQRARCRLRH